MSGVLAVIGSAALLPTKFRNEFMLMMQQAEIEHFSSIKSSLSEINL